MIKSGSETAKILNKFFSNIATNLDILIYGDFHPITENMKDPDYFKIKKSL